MKLKITKSQLKALELFAKANGEGNTTAEEKAQAQVEVKNLIEKQNLQITEKTVDAKKDFARKYFEALAKGDLATFNAKAVAEGSLSTGGSLVPVEASAEIIEALPQYGFAFNKCSTRIMKANSMRVTSVGSGISVSWVTEAGSGAETSITFNPLTLTTGKAMAIGLISNEEIADAVVDVAELVKRVLAAAIAKDVDRVLFLGQAGVFTGLKTLGSVNVVIVANAGTDQEVADALIDMQSAVPAYAMQRGVYVVGTAGWTKMRKLKGSDGHYLARSIDRVVAGNNPQNGNTQTPAGTFDGKDVYVIEGIDAFGTIGNVPVFYGDFTFMVVGVKDEMNALVSKEGTVGTGASQVSLLTTDQTAVRLTSRIAVAGVAGAFARLTLS